MMYPAALNSPLHSGLYLYLCLMHASQNIQVFKLWSFLYNPWILEEGDDFLINVGNWCVLK